MNGSGTPMAAAARREPAAHLAFLGWPMLGLALTEFALGMALNLVAAVPGGDPIGIVVSSPLLILHILLALLLVGISLRALLLAVRVRGRRFVAAGALAFLSAITATLAGLSFTLGGQSAAASYVMALGFAGLVISGALLVSTEAGAGPRTFGIRDPPSPIPQR